MGRKPCCAKEGLNRGAWTAMEDKTLVDYINTHGEGNWRNLPRKAGLKRCGKSCRLRWLNYLRPGIKRGNITNDEEELIIRLHKLLGNRWSLIAGRLPGRTDNEIKNYWNTNIGKKLNHTQKPEYRTTSTKSNPRKRSKSAPNPSTTLLNKVDQSNVIRTKASRCNKVFMFPHELQKPQDNNVSKTEQDNTVHYTPLPPEENLSTGLIIDCEMDKQRLSDLLMIDTDDNTFFDNGAGSDNNVSNYGQRTQFSPDSDTNNHQSLSFPEDLLQNDDLDISSMATFIEFEFDWLSEI